MIGAVLVYSSIQCSSEQTSATEMACAWSICPVVSSVSNRQSCSGSAIRRPKACNSTWLTWFRPTRLALKCSGRCAAEALNWSAHLRTSRCKWSSRSRSTCGDSALEPARQAPSRQRPSTTPLTGRNDEKTRICLGDGTRGRRPDGRRGPGRRPAEEAQHRRHLGRRHRPVRHQRLLARPDGLQDAQHRPDREGRHDVHRHLCRAELHGRPGVVPDRPVRPPHRHDQGRLAGRDGGPAEGRSDGGRVAQAAWVCHRPVRQEPPGRPQRVPADGARLRRVLRQPVSPERRGRARAAGLPEGPGVPREVWPPRRDGLQGVEHGRPDRGPALRQGRQAGVQGHRPPDQGAHGDHR